MRKFLTLSIGLTLAVLTISGTVQAQLVMQVVQGTIQLADCRANTLTLNANDGSHTFTVSVATAVYVDSAASSFCSLSHYVGTHATVWASGSIDPMLAEGVDVGDTRWAPAPYYGGPYGCGTVCCGPAYGPYNGRYLGPCF
jgi:hypothetical protein